MKRIKFFILSAFVLTFMSAFQCNAAVNSQITGTVTGPDGVTPLEGIEVSAWEWFDYGDGITGWTTSTASYTNSEGIYSLGYLTSGTYRIKFVDKNGDYFSECYDNAADLNSATDVVIGQSTVVSGINASLTAISVISGTVTGPDGITPLSGIKVEAARLYELSDGSLSWSWIISYITDSDGRYSLDGLSAGTYRIRFLDQNGDHFSEYYDDASDFDSASDVTVGESAVVSSINASLAEVGRITGTVTGPDGFTPLEYAFVESYRWITDGDGSGAWEYIETVYCNNYGYYTLDNLAAGIYRVRFRDGSGNYQSEYYENATNLLSAKDIIVGDGAVVSAVVSNINASLAKLSKISGTVTGPYGNNPLEYVDVEAYQWIDHGGGVASWKLVASFLTESDGKYSIGLSPGTYRVGFLDYFGMYLSEYYDNAPDLESAMNIVINGDGEIIRADASLQLYGSVWPEIVVESPAGTNLVDGTASLAFGSSNIGKPVVKTVTVLNTGTANLTGLALTRTGANASDYALGALGAATLAPGASTTFTVTFTPTAVGFRNAALQIASNDADENPFDIALGGTGVVPQAPEIVVEQGKGPNEDLKDNKSSRNFGSVKVGKSSKAMVFTIKNVGTAPLTKLGVSLKGRQAKNFKIVKKPTKSVAPGKSTQCKVIYKPGRAKLSKATLQIASNDVDENPFLVKLTGKGIK